MAPLGHAVGRKRSPLSLLALREKITIRADFKLSPPISSRPINTMTHDDDDTIGELAIARALTTPTASSAVIVQL
eukprot:scaffold15855_cov129-Isochrysis_galbana.AAC.1